MKKTSGVYVFILIVWIALLSFFIPAVVAEYHLASDSPFIVNCLLILNAIFIGYFWLNGTKDIVYVIYYYLRRKSLVKYSDRIRKRRLKDKTKKVLLVYCTCDDFEETALKKCLKQSYKNIETVILDDSKNKDYKRRIDTFAAGNGIKVVRRRDRKGFKAGNINHYLRQRKNYDYFVILDSDEIIPRNFVSGCLKYFEYYNNVGIVQCTHIATRNVTPFMKLFHIGVNSHWLTYQSVKHSNGFMSLLGHGAMVSRKCYESTNGMPEVVAEDLCFSIEARNKGYYVAFAPNIVCEEEYPVDYVAFKKRHSKWTQGNFEFMKKYTKKILRANMNWYEKMDIFLFTYNLPLTALFSLYIVINVVLLPLFGYDLNYPSWLFIPTIIFFFAPMINDFIAWFTKIKKTQFVCYMVLTFMLYGSMLYQSIKSSFFALIGRKAVFIVTPKTCSRVSLAEAIKINDGEIVFAVIVAVASLLFKNSVLPVVLIVIPAIGSVFLSMFSNGDSERKGAAIEAIVRKRALR